MRDDQHRHAFLRQLAHHRQHFADALGIERRRRLVEQDRIGPQRQRARNPDALLLPARQRTRQAVRMIGHIDPRQQIHRARGRMATRFAMHKDRRLDDILQHGAVGKQIEPLKHHRHPAADRGQAGRSDHRAIDAYRATVMALQPVDTAQNRRFARTRWPDQAQHFAFGHAQVDAIEHMPFAEPFRDALQLDHAPFAHTSRPLRSSVRTSADNGRLAARYNNASSA